MKFKIDSKFSIILILLVISNANSTFLSLKQNNNLQSENSMNEPVNPPNQQINQPAVPPNQQINQPAVDQKPEIEEEMNEDVYTKITELLKQKAIDFEKNSNEFKEHMLNNAKVLSQPVKKSNILLESTDKNYLLPYVSSLYKNCIYPIQPINFVKQCAAENGINEKARLYCLNSSCNLCCSNLPHSYINAANTMSIGKKLGLSGKEGNKKIKELINDNMINTCKNECTKIYNLQD